MLLKELVGIYFICNEINILPIYSGDHIAVFNFVITHNECCMFIIMFNAICLGVNGNRTGTDATNSSGVTMPHLGFAIV